MNFELKDLNLGCEFDNEKKNGLKKIKTHKLKPTTKKSLSPNFCTYECVLGSSFVLGRRFFTLKDPRCCKVQHVYHTVGATNHYSLLVIVKQNVYLYVFEQKLA